MIGVSFASRLMACCCCFAVSVQLIRNAGFTFGCDETKVVLAGNSN